MKIELTIENKKVICIKKVCKNSKLNTLILLSGASTYDWDFLPLMYSLKNVEIIVINNPEHGVGRRKSEGPAITDANELIYWHAKVIKKLIQDGYATKKVSIIGYSMGGMSLLQLLNRNLLDNILDTAIIMCSYVHTKQNAIEKLSKFYDGKTKKFDIKAAIIDAMTECSPQCIKYIPTRLLSCNGEVCLADIKLGKSMDSLAISNPLKQNIRAKVIAIIGEKDYFFNMDMVKNLENHFTNFELVNIPNGHMFPLEAPILCANIILNAIIAKKSEFYSITNYYSYNENFNLPNSARNYWLGRLSKVINNTFIKEGRKVIDIINDKYKTISK